MLEYDINFIHEVIFEVRALKFGVIESMARY